MQIAVVSLFPEMVRTVAEHGVVGRAMERQLAALRIENPRDYATDTHRTVDDRPYGGGPGMVLKCRPAAEAIRAARLAALPGMILFAGRYEGVDERLIEDEVDAELSLGDFVLSGGEVAAMAVIDAVVRLLPGALGDEDSAAQDSFVEGLLDYPHYTRPEEIEGRRVPAVLLSGDHARIARWRYKQALGRTFLRRPDLVKKLQLDREQQKLLDEFLKEQGRVT
jgi:tRNA (guanine37-N1)-methyltransferase